MEVVDYAHDNDDLKIANGDFVTGRKHYAASEFTYQDEERRAQAVSENRCGHRRFSFDDAPGDVFQEIQKQFEADGMVIRASRYTVR
jgi:hypothetical protein